MLIPIWRLRNKPEEFQLNIELDNSSGHNTISLSRKNIYEDEASQQKIKLIFSQTLIRILEEVLLIKKQIKVDWKSILWLTIWDWLKISPHCPSKFKNLTSIPITKLDNCLNTMKMLLFEAMNVLFHSLLSNQSLFIALSKVKIVILIMARAANL